MFRRRYSEEVYQGDNSRVFEFGVMDANGDFIDISVDYTCKIIADGVDRPVTDMRDNTLFTMSLTAAETAAMVVGCQDAWVIIENTVASPATRKTYRIDLKILENESPDE